MFENLSQTTEKSRSKMYAVHDDHDHIVLNKAMIAQS